jgi:hypothetical protein
MASHTQGVKCLGMPPGVRSALNFQIVGNVNAPQNCIIETQNDNCFLMGDSTGAEALHYVNGLTLRARNPNGLVVPCCAFEMHFSARLKLGPNMILGICEGQLGIHIWHHTGGLVDASPGSPITIAGNQEVDSQGQFKQTMQYHVFNDQCGINIMHGISYVLQNAPRFGCWILTGCGAVSRHDGNTYQGSAGTTGQKWLRAGTGSMPLDVNPDSYFPGSVAGAVTN